ncbi:Mu transposase, C-terminal [Duganella sp. CF402]|uniref:Mu transposase C-terminal domain-containing protein n=1 Tax=unclassified Duganella TaxID=2636909 RepID=UPI0008C56CAF|nr:MULTISPECIES: Mu transposase C-terminal domain-containing protein [unclassified Duganella]RZT06197.1 Mu transposase-like protein [Duganella sp. BK701]SEM72460.1 Mu transposase, C-terminal [Duganella sp. CF402]
MLLRNDLLQYSQPSPRTIRILWIAPEQSHAYVFDVAARSAEVELVPLATLQADLRAGHACVLPADPYVMVVSQELLPAKHLQLRARAWDIIQGLVAQEPEIYEARLRGQMIAQATLQHGVSHPTVYRYLRRYWQRGQTPNALLPDYCNSGARGKVRQSSAGVKRGRPRKNGADTGPGLNADEEIRRTFRVATARYALANPKFSRLGAYQQMLRDFFVERRIDADSGRVLSMPHGSVKDVPTFGQFNYWLDHDDDRPPEVARRPQAVVLPPLPAPAPAPLPPGRPGEGFYLDAVRAEVQLVSRADRNQAIGRPVVYVATDCFSRMVCGVYVGIGEVQWPQAMLALANCGADKQRYAQQYGRRIDAGQWPCRHLPETLFANAALMRGWNGDTLLNNFNLRSAAVDDGPGDWRAVLEKRFRLLTPQQEGGSCRLDGVLDLQQFTRIVIDCILYFNSRHQLAHAGATPRQLWDWGGEHLGGGLKTYPEHLVRCSLMPVAQAQVTSDGIMLFDSLYTCARAMSERWFERARQRGAWSVKLAYDPADLDTVYLLDAAAPLQFHACHLTDASAAHMHLSAAEIARLPRTQMALPGASLRSSTQGFRSLVN